MVLIFAHYYDEEAKWLAANLSKHLRGIKVKLIIAEALGIDYDITLSINSDSSHVTIYFQNPAETLYGENVSFVVNLLSFIDPIVWKKANEKERFYAMNEMNAFFAALIHSFVCPVINPIHNGALFANNNIILQLMKVLSQNGFVIHPAVLEENENAHKIKEIHQATCSRLILLDNSIFYPINQPVSRLNQLVLKAVTVQKITHMLELFFSEHNDFFQLIFISKHPALSVYGTGLLNYLTNVLKTHNYVDDYWYTK